jgi:hypothetical protein
MAKKTIDVTLASIRSAGLQAVSPAGGIAARIVRAVNDEEVHQSESLYSRAGFKQPMHPSGARSIPPDQSLSFNVTKRLTLAKGQPHPHEEDMLIFNQNLEERERHGPDLDVNPANKRYQGPFNRQVRFDEIDGFQTVTCDYHAGGFVVEPGVGSRPIFKIVVTYTVNLISG